MTLEEELEALVTSADYQIWIGTSSYLHVSVHYIPAMRAVDAGGKIPLLIERGEIGHRLFGGPTWWRWRQARRFVRKTIEEHRRLLVETGVRQR